MSLKAKLQAKDFDILTMVLSVTYSCPLWIIILKLPKASIEQTYKLFSSKRQILNCISN